MSLIDSEFMSDLLFPENINNQYFTPSTFSDNLNDFFSEYSQIAPKKDIKFILTKEEYPQQTFLKKKINIKNGDTDQGNSNGGRWTKDEQHRFAEAVLKYGNEWKKIQNHISDYSFD